MTTVALGGCGSDADSASDASTASVTTSASVATNASVSTSDLSAVIAATLEAIDEPGAITFTPSEAACLADSVVAEHGEQRLIELGADQDTDLTALAWTSAERDAVFASILECVDLQSQLTELFAMDPALSADQAACVAESYLNSEVLPDALFSTEPDPAIDARVDAEITAAYESCP